jgi:hypothetical protein
MDGMDGKKGEKGEVWEMLKKCVLFLEIVFLVCFQRNKTNAHEYT